MTTSRGPGDAINIWPGSSTWHDERNSCARVAPHEPNVRDPPPPGNSQWRRGSAATARPGASATTPKNRRGCGQHPGDFEFDPSSVRRWTLLPSGTPASPYKIAPLACGREAAMGESSGSGSGSVSVDVERISFGGKVREQEPCAYLGSFLWNKSRCFT
jgi:hypothetical protein